mgnify:CR=1 FL=1
MTNRIVDIFILFGVYYITAAGIVRGKIVRGYYNGNQDG